MNRHDLSHWPLVLSVEQGAPSLADVQALQQNWNHWLARGERFASLRVLCDVDTLTHPPGSAQSMKAWLQTSLAAIRAQVLGMATVVPASALESLRKMNAEKLFGVPAALFDNVPDALAWLQETVWQPQQHTVDTEAIVQTLEELHKEA